MKKEQYIKIPDYLWNDDRFTPQEVMIICYRIGFADEYFASTKVVAEKFGVDESTVRRAFIKAKKAGLLPNEACDTARGACVYAREACDTARPSVRTRTDSVRIRTHNNPVLPMKTDPLYNSILDNDKIVDKDSSIQKPEPTSNISKDYKKSPSELMDEFNKLFSN